MTKRAVMVSSVEPRRVGLTNIIKRVINIRKVRRKSLCALWFDGAHHDSFPFGRMIMS
jgi:AAA+ ATPase superfamily predicted ATPase